MRGTAWNSRWVGEVCRLLTLGPYTEGHSPWLRVLPCSYWSRGRQIAIPWPSPFQAKEQQCFPTCLDISPSLFVFFWTLLTHVKIPFSKASSDTSSDSTTLPARTLTNSLLLLFLTTFQGGQGPILNSPDIFVFNTWHTGCSISLEGVPCSLFSQQPSLTPASRNSWGTASFLIQSV